MGEGCRSGEGEFEGLFEQEAAEDHEVVPVPILGLHDSGSFELRGIHEVNVVWFTEFVVGYKVVSIRGEECKGQYQWTYDHGIVAASAKRRV